ncbi:MAG: glycoside hydrolase domain-containing protein [Mucilaginibacter sp.]|uniref:glycoside hydrolase domain-containing protein n=1 Tax=Mucilaginibacter sp. TaxID=1882438 RepID=UPI00319F302B
MEQMIFNKTTKNSVYKCSAGKDKSMINSIKFNFSFKLTGISYVSIEQARLNLNQEMNGFNWDFDAAHKKARDTWNNLLSKIRVDGGTEENKKKFYTNMYRAYYNHYHFVNWINNLFTNIKTYIDDFPCSAGFFPHRGSRESSFK